MATIQPRNPVQIFNAGADEQKQESARIVLLRQFHPMCLFFHSAPPSPCSHLKTAYSGAIAVADLIKTTLGPKGMDKILQSMGEHGDISVTNDGATILKSLYIDNPASKIIVEVSKSQDNEVGDGTTSVVVLAGELLREADQLVQENVHPQIIIAGWRKAVDTARAALEASAIDNSKDDEKFREDLMNIARTTLSSKVLGHGYKEKFAKMAVDAVLRLKGSTNLEMIHYIKEVGASLEDSFLDEGFVLAKKIGVGQPKRVENAKIMVANTAMDHDKIKIFGAVVEAESPDEVAAIEKAERQRMTDKCEKILAHGINCFINRQLIYNLPEQIFADHGVASIEHADFEGVERLAFVTGGDIVSTFDNPDKVTLGSAGLIEEIMVGEKKMIRFSGCKRGEACTIVLRGSSHHLLDEAQRSLHDALSVLSQTVATEKRTVLGAGCSEMIMAKAVDELAKKTAGKESIAIESFARALRKIPTIIADNGGYDSVALISELRAAHHNGRNTAGLDMRNGKVADARELAIVESFKVKRQVLLSAAEAAEMILRIDEVIRSAPRERTEDPRYAH